MKTCWALAAILAFGATAAAQDDSDSLRREHERAMRALEEKQRAERERMDQEFRSQLERAAKPHQDLERRCEELLRQIESLAEEVRKLQSQLGGRPAEAPRRTQRLVVPKLDAPRTLEDVVPELRKRALELQKRFKKDGDPQEFEFELQSDENDGAAPRARAILQLKKALDKNGKPQVLEFDLDEDENGETPVPQKRVLELKKFFKSGDKPQMFESDEDGEEGEEGAAPKSEKKPQFRVITPKVKKTDKRYEY